MAHVALALALFASLALAAAAPLPPHPRLILTPARAATIRSLASSTDPFAREFSTRTIEQAQWENGTAKHLLGRPLVQAVYSLCVGAALTSSGDDESFRSAVARLLLLATNGTQQWETNGTISLTSGETLHATGLAFDWVHDILTPTQRAAVVEGIITAGLARVRDALGLSPPPWAVSWVSTRSNWNTVVLSGAIIACLAVEGEPGAPAWVPALRAAAVSNLLEWSASAWGPSGAWPEGGNYGGYTERTLVPLIASLISATGDDAGIRSLPGVLLAPRFLSAVVAPTRPYPTLFDYFDARKAPETIASYLAMSAWADDAPAAARIKELLLSVAPYIPVNDTETTSMNAPLAILYYTPLGHPGDEIALPLVSRFLGEQVVTARSSWTDVNATYIAFKGLNTTGNWAHTHLDQGSFVFATHGQWFAQDLGSDNYSARDYFSKGRFDLYRTNISGHNTLSFSGHNPLCDIIATYAANCTPALITVYNETTPRETRRDAEATLSVDLYSILDLTAGLEHLKYTNLARVQRGFVVGAGRTQLVTVDEVEFSATPVTVVPVPPLWWTLHTVANVSLSHDLTVATLSVWNVTQPVTVAFLPAASVCPGAAFSVHPLTLAPPLLPTPGVNVLRLTVPQPEACARIVVAVGIAPPGVGAGVRPLAEWEKEGPLL